MKGARALASGMLVLVAVCAVPAISAAQDQGTTTTTPSEPAADPTVPAAPDPVTPVPAEPSTGGAESNAASKPDQAQAPTVTAAPAPTAKRDAAPKDRAAHSSSSVTVSMGDFFFSPSSVSIKVGDTVTWRNNGQAPHNATANDGSFKTRDLNNGQSASHTFSSPGTFSYICTIHPNMTGTVRVSSSSSSGGGGGGSSSSGASTSSGSSGVSSSSSSTGSSSSLPMTGLAVGSIALVGLALLAAGLVLHRVQGPGGIRRLLPPF